MRFSCGFKLLFLALLTVMSGCSNILRSGLMNDGSIMLPPSSERTIYVQVRNTSENQSATPTDVMSRLSGKGYTVTEAAQAAYWLQSQIVYCHKAAENVTPEMVAKTGFGSGIGSGGAPLPTSGASDMVSLFAGRGGAIPDMNTMVQMAMHGGRMGMTSPRKAESVSYICVADVLVTERGASGKGEPRIHKKRSVAHVLQKELNVEEATPILREKLAVALTGPF